MDLDDGRSMDIFEIFTKFLKIGKLKKKCDLNRNPNLPFKCHSMYFRIFIYSS